MKSIDGPNFREASEACTLDMASDGIIHRNFSLNQTDVYKYDDF